LTRSPAPALYREIAAGLAVTQESNTAPASAAETVDDLCRAGFTESRENPIGWFEIQRDALVVRAASQTESARLRFSARFSASKIVQILALPDNSTLAQDLPQDQLDAQLIPNVSLRNRERRRLLRFGEIPSILIDAVVSVEDRRFFRHQGFDLFRIVKAAYVNLRKGRTAEGASTIMMQLVRSLRLKPDRSWKRRKASSSWLFSWSGSSRSTAGQCIDGVNRMRLSWLGCHDVWVFQYRIPS
jgi:hypothetical protein